MMGICRSAILNGSAIALLVAVCIGLGEPVFADDIRAKLPSNDGSDAFQVRNSDDASVMHVQSDGKAGIGTTTPDAKLEIDPGSTSIVPLAIKQGFSHSTLINFLKNSDSSNIFAITLQGSGDIPTFFDYNDGTSKASIAMKAGNVGIGYVNQTFGGRLLVNGSVGVGTTDQFGGGAGVLSLGNAATNPSTGLTDAAALYASGGELYAYDAAGNATQISPHDPETGEWIFYSKNTKTGRVVRINMEKMVKRIEELTGESFMEEWIEN